MKKRRQEKGLALLLVLVVVALLASLLTDLAFSTMVDMRLTETFRDSTKAYYLAKGGINAGRMILQNDVNRYDSLNEPWSRGVLNYPVGDGNVSIRIMDQDGKLALNSLVTGDNPNSTAVDRFYRFLMAMELDSKADPAELTAALIDWIDSGDSVYSVIRTDEQEIPVAGAEQAYYASLTSPYMCKNGPLETLDELTLIRGFTPEIVRMISPHLAVNGNQAINLNTASAEVLMSLDQKIDREMAQTLLDVRQEEPIQEIQQLADEIDANVYTVLKTLENVKQLGTTSEFFRIESVAMVNDGSRRLLAEVNKKNNTLLFFRID